tara:strand:- start:9 stop:230 length:222 start_codon:yes stop_codon:yes gene_type:complete
MFGDILKGVILSKFGKKAPAPQPDIYLPEVNFTKFFVNSPQVETSRVVSAVRSADLQASSKYFRFLESLMLRS